MSEQLTKVSEFINNSERQMVELQTILTACPALAPENGGDGEYEKCNVLKKWLIDNGLTNIQCFEAPDSRVSSGVRPSIVVTIPGKSDDFSVWVMAHLDVVPPGEKSLWNSDPWKVVEKDGKLYGRGVEDNQQGLVSSVFASLALVKLGIQPEHTVKLLFMADEEVGSKYGIIWLLKNTNLFKKDDIIIIPDGGDEKGETIEIAEKNIMWLKVRVSGKQAHGSRPDQGNNACLAANDLSLKLHELQSVFDKRDSLFEPDYSTFQPTMRYANVDGVNIIPGEDVFCMDCRILPCYSLKEVLVEVNKSCKSVEAKYGVKVSYEIIQSSESPATPKDAPVVKMLAAAIKKTRNIDAKVIGIGGGTVGAELRREGYNAAVWSTLAECAHMPNEFCVIKNMKDDAFTLATLMLE